MNISEKVKYIMATFNLSLDETAKFLGITTQSLRNKLNRDSFSIKDLVIISHMCTAELNIRFIVHDEIHPVVFEYESLPKEDLDRIRKLETAKMQYALEHLEETLSKLPPGNQQMIMQYLNALANHKLPDYETTKEENNIPK